MHSDFTTSDLSMLARFGVNHELLADAGVRRVTDAQARELFTGHPHGDLAGLLFPYLDPTTGYHVTCRIRRDHPDVDADGKPTKKYVMPYGDAPHVYFSPGAGAALADVAVPVVLVEAEKSALTVTAAGRRAGRPLLTVGLGGCFGWRTSRAGKSADASGARVNVSGPQPDLARITWPGRDVAILFDANAATNPTVRQARRQLAEELVSRGARVRIGTVPAEPGVNGPDDFRAAHDDTALLALLDDAVPVQPSTVDELLEDCGAMALPSPCDASHAEPVIRSVRNALRGADALRQSAVRSKLVAVLKEHGINDAARLVDAALGPAPESASTKPALVQDTQPWPEPVDGARVIDAVLDIVRRYVVMPRLAAAAALWILHTYLMDAWQNSPILAAVSPTRRCGKTVLLTVSGKLVYRPLSVANVTTATLFRLIEKEHPTLLLDEADCWLDDDKSDLRGAVNCGHTKSSAVFPRCEGDNHEVKLFSVWAAKLLAMIGKPPPTIRDRSIVITMQRMTKTERLKPLRTRTLDLETQPIRQQLKRWADDHLAELTDAEPLVPDVLNDRAADSWRPLLAIADALGGAWPQVARQAATDLSGQLDDAEDDTLPIQLLTDVRQVFLDAVDPPHLETTPLLERLKQMAERPWGEWGKHGKGITAHGLARQLRPFAIDGPRKIRTGATTTVRGYHRSAFVDAWTRYCPPDPLFPDIKVEQTEQTNESGLCSRVSEVEQTPLCSTSKHEKTPMNPASVPLFHFDTPQKGNGPPPPPVFDPSGAFSHPSTPAGAFGPRAEAPPSWPDFEVEE